LGIVLDTEANNSAQGEEKISAARSRVQIWVIPTNEELIVARQAAQLLSEG
jgi:acetate kinase